jgi:CRISPR-associated protein Cas5h
MPGDTPDAILAFELRGSLAHFRRPDTTITQATYPFITRTALRGLLGAILGDESLLLEEDAWVGIRLLAPVRTQVVGMLLLGKGYFGTGDRMFSRRTAVELVVTPHYRVYYAGVRQEDLYRRIAARESMYPTYLGSAFALTFPERPERLSAEPVLLGPDEAVTAVTVVPASCVRELVPRDGAEYGRMGGVLYRYLGGRRFRGAVALLYETEGGPLTLRPAPPPHDPPVRWYRTPEGVVALW